MSTKSLSVKLNSKSSLKITIFAIPKAFNGQIEIIQRNAITSWIQLNPAPEIVLFGEEKGTKSIAKELGIIHISDVKVNSQKTPLLNDVFNQIKHLTSSDILTYVNSDIILPRNFISIVEQVVKKYKQFLIVGRRWNLDVKSLINFDNYQWEEDLQNRLKAEGIFSGVGALDYFVFPKPLFAGLPEFAVGRAGWDNWMIAEALKNNYPVINASQVINIIHQNHDYNHLSGGRLEAFFGAEAKKNLTFVKQNFRANSANATHYLIPESNTLVKVSIVIAINLTQELGFLEKTLKSIEQQKINNIEVIIIDNFFKNNDLEKIFNQYPFVRYIKSSKCEIITALNQGLQLAQGEFISFLNPGHLLPENIIREAIKSFENQAGSLEFVLGGWQVIDNQNKIIQECQCWHSLESILIGKEGLHGFHIWMLPTMWKIVQLSSFLFRRSWVLDCGGFDPDLLVHSATLDLLLKLSSKGAAGFCLPQVTSIIPQSVWVKTQALKENKTDCKIILDKYFQRPILRKWMLPLKSEAENITNINLSKSQTILIHTMGKVGSTSVMKSFKALETKFIIYYTHILNDNRLKKSIKRAINLGQSVSGHLKDSQDFLQNYFYNNEENQEYKIVTLIREPISRNLSAFFQNIDNFFPNFLERYNSGSLPINDIAESFLTNYDHELPLNWLDTEINSVFGLDVFSKSFPQEQGYIIFDKPVKLILIKLENLNKCYQEAFKKFLGINEFKLIKANVGQNKAYKDAYQKLNQSLVLKDSYIKKMYQSKYAQHFYSKDELDTFTNKWTGISPSS